jgi:hypothetical protein
MAEHQSDRCRRCGGPDGAFGIRWPSGTFSVARDCRTFDDARAWAMASFPGSRVEKDGRMWMPKRGKFCQQDGTVTRISLSDIRCQCPCHVRPPQWICHCDLTGRYHPDHRFKADPICADCRAAEKISETP